MLQPPPVPVVSLTSRTKVSCHQSFHLRYFSFYGREIFFVMSLLKMGRQGFPGGAMVKNLPANAGDMGSSPGLGRSHMPQNN